MEFYGLDGYRLKVIQGVHSDSLMSLTSELSAMMTKRETERNQAVELSAQVNSLNELLGEYTRYELLAEEIRGEMSTLFPQVGSLSLSRVNEVQSDTPITKYYVAAIVGTAKGKTLQAAEKKKLTEWLQVRVKADSLVVIYPQE